MEKSKILIVKEGKELSTVIEKELESYGEIEIATLQQAKKAQMKCDADYILIDLGLGGLAFAKDWHEKSSVPTLVLLEEFKGVGYWGLIPHEGKSYIVILDRVGHKKDDPKTWKHAIMLLTKETLVRPHPDFCPYFLG